MSPQVSFKEEITLKVLRGTAEIFGTELANERAYRFKGTKGAVFSWHGADIQVRILFSA